MGLRLDKAPDIARRECPHRCDHQDFYRVPFAAGLHLRYCPHAAEHARHDVSQAVMFGVVVGGLAFLALMMPEPAVGCGA